MSSPPQTSVPAQPASLLLNDVMTTPSSLAGLPAISVPFALVPAGAGTGAGGAGAGGGGGGHGDGDAPLLPLGLQLIAPAFGEHVLLRAAAALEARAGFEPLA